MSTAAPRPRVLVVAPFTHQNGHFVTFPRDVACGLTAAGCEVTLLHARPFRTELDWFGHDIRRICLKDGVEAAPRLWREIWHRLADYPSTQCLAWLIWKVRHADHDLVLWTDFQAQVNVWPLQLARWLGLYRGRTVFFEHHPPFQVPAPAWGWLPNPERLRLFGLTMAVASQALEQRWRARVGAGPRIAYQPYGVWPAHAKDLDRQRARSRLGIAPGACVLLVFGVQASRRKHLDTLRRALNGHVPVKPLVLLFTGKCLDPDPHPFAGWSAPGIDVRIDDDFVIEPEVTNQFAAADVVWALYRDFPGASGILLQSMGFGRIAITTDFGEMGALCRVHGLGFVVPDPSELTVREVLTRAAELSSTAQCEWEGKIHAVAERYSWPVVMRRLMVNLTLLPKAD